MGALIYDFPATPADNDPDKVRLYTNIYADLQAIGVPTPATPPNAITRAALVAHLQAQAGALVKAELQADSEGIYTGGPTDAQLATLINNPYVPPNVRRFPGSSNTGYQVAAGGTSQVITLVTNPGLANPGFLALQAAAQAAGAVLGLNVALRFRNNVSVIANRGAFHRVLTVNSDNQLGLQAAFPVVPAVGDICDLGFAVPSTIGPRINQVMARFPHGPNGLTAADITAAKV